MRTPEGGLHDEDITFFDLSFLRSQTLTKPEIPGVDNSCSCLFYQNLSAAQDVAGRKQLYLDPVESFGPVVFEQFESGFSVAVFE